MRGFKEATEDKELCCGTCAYHQNSYIVYEFGDDWVCTNPGSIYYSERTEFREYCAEHEDRIGGCT